MRPILWRDPLQTAGKDPAIHHITAAMKAQEIINARIEHRFWQVVFRLEAVQSVVFPDVAEGDLVIPGDRHLELHQHNRPAGDQAHMDSIIGLPAERFPDHTLTPVGHFDVEGAGVLEPRRWGLNGNSFRF
jgi:hypothetical protein